MYLSICLTQFPQDLKYLLNFSRHIVYDSQNQVLYLVSSIGRLAFGIGLTSPSPRERYTVSHCQNQETHYFQG